jgi:hypothetical protein
MKNKSMLSKPLRVLTLMSINLGMCAAVFCAETETETVTLDSLLKEMVNRDTLARLPEPSYTCKQASSYDRHSTEPGSPTWWANADRSYFVRIEEANGRKEHVLMDEKGPGAIVRFWATWHGPGGGPFSNGTLRVYLDHNPKPVIEGPMEDLVSRGGLVNAPLSNSVSPETDYRHRGHNLYLPIPYAKHCKVTYETEALIDLGARKGEALYYQINFRTYEETVRVESFNLEDMKRARFVPQMVNAMLAKNQRTGLDNTSEEHVDGSILPGQEHSVTIDGSRAIRALTLQVQAGDLPQALRSTVVQLSFDGTSTVWCPLGDFFGTGYHVRAHATWYTEVTQDNRLSCYWVMPFKQNAEIRLINLGSAPITVTDSSILHGPWDWDERSCYFSAAWKQWPHAKTQSNTHARDHGALDLNWITLQGQGTYVGDVLTLFNTAGTWWGEGDEKIYVDGESFPSHIGTGTEDYYGYAWCKPNYFEAPFHAQPSGDGNLTPGFSVNLRYRSLDAIPFTKSLKFDMELWHWAKTTMSYAPTTIWYARPGTTRDVKPSPKEAKRAIPRKVEDIVKPRRVKNALEGETLTLGTCSGGSTEIQNIPQFNWSDNRQLWWKHGKIGDSLQVEFPAKEAGRFDVMLGTTKAVDYGLVSMAVNGQTVIDSTDLYHSSVTAVDMSLPGCPLVKGKNILKITILGANPSAVKSHMFGLDYLLISNK